MIKKMTVYMASLCLLMTGLLAMGINSDDSLMMISKHVDS